MNPFLQQVLVAAAIIGAVLYLVLRARKKKDGKSGCSCVKKDPLK